MQLATILGHANRVEMFISLTAFYPRKDLIFLCPAIQRNQSQDRHSDHLLSRVTKDAFCTFIPTCNDAVEILSNDRIVRVIHNCCQAARDQIGMLTPSHNPEAPHSTGGLSPSRNDLGVALDQASVDQFKQIKAFFLRG